MFNQRIYTNDGMMPFLNVDIGSKPNRNTKRTIQVHKVSECNLDTDRLSIRGPRDNSKMNRSVFEMKPNERIIIMDNPVKQEIKEIKKEGYCGLHQKYARVHDMNYLIGSAPFENKVNEIGRNKLKKEFEDSIKSFSFQSKPSEIPEKDAFKKDAFLKESFKKDAFLKESFKKESFSNGFISSADKIYKLKICSDIESILSMLENIECFHPYNSYWKDLRRNLNKNNWNVNILPTDDDDIAYSINKGEKLNFKTRDSKTYLPMKIMIYVLCHELAHVACTKEIDHTETFSKTMWLIECAAFMTGLLKPKDYPIKDIMFSEKAIVSKEIVKEELIIGFTMLKESGSNLEYIEAVLEYLKKI